MSFFSRLIFLAPLSATAALTICGIDNDNVARVPTEAVFIKLRRLELEFIVDGS
jgi:hypothetical protein